MSSLSFRQLFPALERQAWLDTAASAPGVTPVTSALASAIASWQEGSLGAADWEAVEAGAMPVSAGQPSHIAAVRVSDPDSVGARLRAAGVRARMLGDRLRVGFHYFNNDEDLAAALGALRG